MDKVTKQIVAILVAVLIIVPLAYFLIFRGDGEEPPQKWSFIQEDVSFYTDKIDGITIVNPTYAISNNTENLGNQGSYIWVGVKITIKFPLSYDTIKISQSFLMKCYPTDTALWYHVDPYNGISYTGMLQVGHDPFWIYFVVPGSDPSYIPQPGEFIVSYTGSMVIQS